MIIPACAPLAPVLCYLSRGLWERMKRLRQVFSFLFLCLVIASCTDIDIPAENEPAATPVTFPTLAAATPEAAITPAELTTDTLSPTETNLPPTETLVPSPTATLEPSPTPTVTPVREFDAFVQRVMNGDPNQIVGVYVEGTLALPVVQQPAGSPAWVSYNDDETTQFLLAYTIAGNIGLIAHNFLAGRYFFNLYPGQIVELVYGDGSVVEYEISTIDQYQALQPDSPYSDFVDLVSGETISANDLFYRVYGGEHHLTFQTCISRDNNTEWGRLFPIAYPYQ